MGVIAAIFVILFVTKSKRNKFAALVVAAVGMILMAMMAYALYAALDKPLYTTRAMYAIGAFMAIVGIFIVSEMGSNRVVWKKLMILPVVVLAWCFFVFSFTYGNALREQNEYRNAQVNMVLSDLNSLPLMVKGGTKVIQVEGQIGFAPAVAHMSEDDYVMLRRLLKPSFGKDVPWMAYEITQGSGMDNLVFKPEMDLSKQNLPILKDTVFYTIYGDDEGILVNFKGEEFGIEF